MTGAYAVLVSSSAEPGVLVAARSGPPIALGLGKNENWVASDPVALVPWTRDVVFLEDGDVARVDAKSVKISDAEGRPRDRATHRILWDAVAAEKGGYRHFMAKEIHEQPTAVAETLGGKVSLATGVRFRSIADGAAIERPARTIDLDPIAAAKSGYKHFMLKEIFEQPESVRDSMRGRVVVEEGLARLGGLNMTAEEMLGIKRIIILGCGTSWHAALIGKFLIEGMARMSVEVDYGSEFRYRSPVVDGRTLTVGVSQSGETADTMAALTEARGAGSPLVAIVNVAGSQMARTADAVIETHAGPEIGVASTKAFTTQLAVLFLLAAKLRESRALGRGLTAQERAGLVHLPSAIQRALSLERKIENLARDFHSATNFLFLGRGLHYPVALEGALKLKEISYIHAEGYPAGEMKHGPIALVDENLPVVVLAPNDAWREKTLSNLREVKSRDGISLVVTTREDEEIASLADHSLVIPETIPELQPIVSVVPLQLLAYHMAVRRGCDVDQPRNLAKSVTVE